MSEDSIEREGIKWGAEIAVDGKRPEWLDEGQTIWFRNQSDYQTSRKSGGIWFDNVIAIRLPADHPYYVREKAKEIDPALIERMVALVRSAANGEYISAARAKSIIGEIEPVDPDLIEARLCVVKAYESIGRKDLALQADSGKMDNRLRVQACLAAIKRGRELETNA